MLLTNVITIMINPAHVEAVMTFIRAYVAEHKTGPLVKEIAAGCGICSETAGDSVRRLIEQKRLQRTWRRRSIAPAGTPEDTLKLSRWRKQKASRDRSARWK